MKFYISYFYQIRFFKPNQIPVSTALSDPKWYHQNKGGTFKFIDKNGVLNGLRSPILNPQTTECGECVNKIENCAFKRHYKWYLNTLDFDKFIAEVTNGIREIAVQFGIKEPEVVFMVYETPDNPCSERGPLIEWFKEHGVILQEFEKS